MDLQERLTSLASREADGSRVLVTLLFTDLIGSTERAVALGDRRWQGLLERHHGTVRDLLDRFGGCEVDTAGDGFLATFSTASHAVGCGFEVTRSLSWLGLDARVGVHTGECDRFGPKYSGVAVHVAARVVRLAGPREVLVTETVKGVVAGAGLRFAERGRHSLKGLPGVWPLYAAVEPDPVALGPHAPRPRATGRRARVARLGA
ncbi:MAG: adenylate/guanylate cyclase domain-containing protein [Actinobacteria bacterium]|nr:MAG: adenylate/guanylate cyclase domain-containing protein [Actinomycetota bacterium]